MSKVIYMEYIKKIQNALFWKHTTPTQTSVCLLWNISFCNTSLQEEHFPHSIYRAASNKNACVRYWWQFISIIAGVIAVTATAVLAAVLVVERNEHFSNNWYENDF